MRRQSQSPSRVVPSYEPGNKATKKREQKPAGSRRRAALDRRTSVLEFFLRTRERARPPERGTSGSVQRGPANPARPGREQRYRVCLGCRRSPEVPLAAKSFQPKPSVVSKEQKAGGAGVWLGALCFRRTAETAEWFGKRGRSGSKEGIHHVLGGNSGVLFCS